MNGALYLQRVIAASNAQSEAAPFEHRRRRHEAADRDASRTPHTLLSFAKYDEAAELILTGLYNHYLECAASGRLDKWKAAAHSAVELLADAGPANEFVSRRTMPVVAGRHHVGP